jgi:hypothetical protein
LESSAILDEVNRCRENCSATGTHRRTDTTKAAAHYTRVIRLSTLIVERSILFFSDRVGVLISYVLFRQIAEGKLNFDQQTMLKTLGVKF